MLDNHICLEMHGQWSLDSIQLYSLLIYTTLREQAAVSVNKSRVCLYVQSVYSIEPNQQMLWPAKHNILF